ncbi:hypothetical protein JOC77_003768 [Peribacillus deserti]|uniref:Uncharacterized protein n=1 Tax=Peribacillus deserti TaxID=673318 RepID=A0ABS2QMA3_9BACI|nr:hypothetical protein [Peribacillus deserti]
MERIDYEFRQKFKGTGLLFLFLLVIEGGQIK